MKTFFILLFIPLLSLLNTFFSLVEVSQSSSKNTIVGSDPVIITVKINKGDVQGFAKLQQEFPEGFDVKAVETQGASFSFEEHKAKLIWMSLPSATSFEVSYEIISSDWKGDLDLKGKFSYIENGQKVEAMMEPITIEFSKENNEPLLVSSDHKDLEREGNEIDISPMDSYVDDEMSLATNEVDSNIELEEEVSYEAKRIAESSNITPATYVDEVTVEVKEVKKQETPTIVPVDRSKTTPTITADIKPQDIEVYESSLSVSRSIKVHSANSYRVKCYIDYPKGGFVKIEDVVPSSFSVNMIQGSGAKYKRIENSVQFVWNDYQQSVDTYVEYEVTGSNNMGIVDVQGSYYFEDESEIVQKAPITQFRLFDLTQDMTDSYAETRTASDISDSDDSYTSDDVIDTPRWAPVAQIKSSSPRVIYKVQVAASIPIKPVTYFIDKYEISEPMIVYQHNGWNKYLVGSYTSMDAAVSSRNYIRRHDRLSGAFVTAYYNNQRISLKEAASIAKGNA